jgi:hypothetical protein
MQIERKPVPEQGGSMGRTSMPEATSRPPILTAAAAVWAALVLAWPAAGQGADPVAPSGIEFRLRARGDLFATASARAEPVRRPIVLDACFEFTEQPVSDADGDVVLRRYATARADIETDGRRMRQQLGSDAREILMRLEGTMPRPYLADGFLSRDEAELLDVPFDPVLFDGLKPAHPIAEGGSWKLPADLVAGLLAIDTVDSGGLEATLAIVHDDTATVNLRGTVVGAADGAPTRIEVRGRVTAQAVPADAGSWRIMGPVTALDATIAERREAGWVAPGLDVEATVTFARSQPSAPDADATATTAASPAQASPATDDLGPAATDRPAGQGRPGMVWHHHRHGRYTSVLDARWRVVEDGPEGLVLRLSDRGRLVAQCSILPLPRVSPDEAPAEETVREDVRRSLADQFGLLAESEATSREDGTRVVRVVAEGAADGRPFRWIHYVLTGPTGHRVAATFMHEPALIERFAAADRELVAGLVVLPEPPARQAVTPAASPR